MMERNFTFFIYVKVKIFRPFFRILLFQLIGFIAKRKTSFFSFYFDGFHCFGFVFVFRLQLSPSRLARSEILLRLYKLTKCGRNNNNQAAHDAPNNENKHQISDGADRMEDGEEKCKEWSTNMKINQSKKKDFWQRRVEEASCMDVNGRIFFFQYFRSSGRRYHHAPVMR